MRYGIHTAVSIVLPIVRPHDKPALLPDDRGDVAREQSRACANTALTAILCAAAARPTVRICHRKVAPHLAAGPSLGRATKISRITLLVRLYLYCNIIYMSDGYVVGPAGHIGPSLPTLRITPERLAGSATDPRPVQRNGVILSTYADRHVIPKVFVRHRKWPHILRSS